MTILWRSVFIILPLLFVAGNCHVAADTDVISLVEDDLAGKGGDDVDNSVDGFSSGGDGESPSSGDDSAGDGGDSGYVSHSGQEIVGDDGTNGISVGNDNSENIGDGGDDGSDEQYSSSINGDGQKVKKNKNKPPGPGNNKKPAGGGNKAAGVGNKAAGAINNAAAAAGAGFMAPTNSKGQWEIFSPNSGINAMHLVLLPKINQVLMFDATVWKISKLRLPGPPCRIVEGPKPEEDCWCHSILMDINDATKIRPLRLKYDTWCSSGALDTKGRLVSTGGYNNGSDTVRILDICPTCEWQEYPGSLGNGRWYATQVTLGDGKFMVFGGRNFPSYEFVPLEGQKNAKNQVIDFKFLAETHDPVENNLYPFVYLNTDGTLFVFANNRSILLDPTTQKVVHEFPVLPGGARNYPASGSSCLLPIDLNKKQKNGIITAEVLVCGGAPHNSFTLADLNRPKVFVDASRDCARLDISKRNGKWKIINMPSPRVMGDALILPTGDVLLINGAKKGSAGWDDAREPNFTPVLYRFRGGGQGSKFEELKPSQIARMYHSTSALLPDGKILIAGSNTNPGYFDQALFPTELRVEKFSPPYFDPNLSKFRVILNAAATAAQIRYGQTFTVQMTSPSDDLVAEQQNLQASIYYPAFTTHGISMNQRLVLLPTQFPVKKGGGPLDFVMNVQAPANGNVAPPGYYMLYVNFKGVPCQQALWVQLI